MTSQKKLMVMAMCLAMVPLFSCDDGRNNDEEGGGGDGNKITIAWIPKEKDNQVFETGLDGARLKALELTQATKHEVEILYLAPQSAADIEGQKASVQEAIDAKVDGIAISCSSTDLAEKVDEAIAAGIPTMSWDSDCRYPDGTASGRFTYLGIDNRSTGQTATELAGAALTRDGFEPPWRVGLFSGVPVSTNLQARVAGVWDFLKEEGSCLYEGTDDPQLVACWPDTLESAPETATYHVFRDEPDKCQNSFDENFCATVYAELETEASGEQFDEMVARDRDGDGEPDLDAVILIGLWPLFAYSDDEASNGVPEWTARMKEGSLKTITYDALQFQIDMAKDGLIDALIGQKYWGWGYDVVQMVYDTLVNGAVYDEAFVDSGADIICPNNWDDISQMWTSGDFTQELTPCGLLE
jgi:ribose transport system substrate-binding protein